MMTRPRITTCVLLTSKHIRQRWSSDFFLEYFLCRRNTGVIWDNDSPKIMREFDNSASTELHQLIGIHQRLTSVYHPQANGLAEKQNGTIRNKLLKVLQGTPKGLSRSLEPLLFSHRTTVDRSTKMTPFILMYGRQLILPVDFSNHLDGSDMTDNDSNFIYGNDEEEISEFNEDEVTKVMEMIYPHLLCFIHIPRILFQTPKFARE
ncbi:unnamed protein product [Lepeophtheirus salmonis]|uniref:(salmon louse) hypothetical protein n=1 Tax=Lepeophtheirus salmonis TaxID=72036 RepID=A0A7R8HCD4_LEPSM|nr:unnamed protein product [Lepeophtheirus salmonis]CAF2999797.1 unnamed protein product [Lepeophtheirus salmonis]